MTFVYRPAPAELQASVAASSSSSSVNSDTKMAAYAELCALVSAHNFKGVNPMKEYPINKHAGPMFIHEKQNTFCGICGMCITLEDEQAVSRSVNPYTTTGPGTVEHADAGNEEFESLQQETDDVNCCQANERKFGVMPKPGWTGLYRVVVREKKKLERGQDTPSYYISGVGRYHLWDSDPKARKMYNNCRYSAGEPIFTIPVNKEEALVDRQHFYNKELTQLEKRFTTQKKLVKRVSVYPCHFHDDGNQNLFPHGFPIHDNCWKMAASVIGADKLEKNLNSFLTVLQDRWDDNGTALAESCQIANWIVDEKGDRSRAAWYQDVGTLMTDRDNQYDINRILVALNDPIHIDEVQEMIAESARRYKSAKEEETGLGESGDEFDDTLSASSSATFSAISVVTRTGTSDRNLYAVPPESMMTILDELHYSAVESFLEVSKLRVPSSYWRKRAPRDVIWELNSIDDRNTPLDWQYLCLSAEELCEESLGLINRQRICNILTEVDEAMA